MGKVPEFVEKEIKLLAAKYRNLQEVYASDEEWVMNGTMYLKGNDLELANWINRNTLEFEKEFIRVKEVMAEN